MTPEPIDGNAVDEVVSAERAARTSNQSRAVEVDMRQGQKALAVYDGIISMSHCIYLL